ncbi:uncharacterized protein FIBRA_01859 [Fibroporia radiculosa]|uniref:Uncharacterized protein n=1 Tax=Fibroporia radiculosa TaxID=599839 RepID=J4GLL2_9APHY|nr:uncharacterized protein FIBRA_01859 [Fibroporia radiculosa]CCL99835.1 predicted protein [Fibroporia radiculosa]
MPSTSLLTASLYYGVVARSYPLRGKVLRGFLDASGTANGLGWGNPNAEFSPHLSAIALASEGLSARILWGFRNGEVAVTTAARAMDEGRVSAAKHVRCKPRECHDGVVLDVAWGMDGVSGSEGLAPFVTGAADGRIKLWNAKRLACLWTSERKSGLVADACVKVRMNVSCGIVAGAMESGDVVLWSGLASLLSEEGSGLQTTPHEIRLPAVRKLNTPANSDDLHEISALHLTIGPDDTKVSILVSYRQDPHFYRLNINLATDEVERLSFGDGSFGSIHSLQPVFAIRKDESDFVIVGDQLGYVGIFDWTAHPTAPASTISPVRRFLAHEDGAVTALSWSTTVFVSGSARGTLKVWDSLTFAPLRTFVFPSSRPTGGAEWDAVQQILLDKDVLVASIANKVVAWQAGRVETHNKKGKGKQVRTTKNSGLAKWQQQIELSRDIADSRRDLEEEQTHTRRVFGREREQQSTLAHLGLNEVEALEYVLMLSRDEEERRHRQSSARVQDEGVFMSDFDDVDSLGSTPLDTNNGSLVSGSSRSSSFSNGVPSRNSVVISGRSVPRTVSSSSNHKIQISPRMDPEPVEAGFGTSPLGSMVLSFGTQGDSPLPITSDMEQFPVISRTPSSSGASLTSAPASPIGVVRHSMSGSPESFRSVWSTPLQSWQSSSSVHSSPRGPIASSPSAMVQRIVPPIRQSVSGPSLIATGFARQTNPGVSSHSFVGETNEDDDLRFALELSLAEAVSRGEHA